MDEQQDLQKNTLWRYVQKVKERIKVRNKTTALSIVATIAVVLAIPVTVLVSQQRQNLQQRASEMETSEKIFEGVLGVNPSNNYYLPSVIESNGILHVFVIGEGRTNINGEFTNKPAGDWYNLFEIHYDGNNWSGYTKLGGNLSTSVLTAVEGNNLYVFGKGYDFSNLNDIKPSEQIYVLKATNNVFDLNSWATVNPGGISSNNERVPYTAARQNTNVTYKGKQISLSITPDGKLKAMIIEPGSNNGGGNTSPSPVPQNGGNSGQREYDCGRCSKNNPGAWADFKTYSPVCNDSTQPILERPINYSYNDARCPINGAPTQPPAAPSLVYTPVPTRIAPIREECPNPSKLRRVTRCSNNYACTHATFLTLDPVDTTAQRNAAQPYTGPLCDWSGNKIENSKIEYSSSVRTYGEVHCPSPDTRNLPHMSEPYNGGMCDFCNTREECPRFTGPQGPTCVPGSC